jgi:hypothetical protein
MRRYALVRHRVLVANVKQSSNWKKSKMFMTMGLA